MNTPIHHGRYTTYANGKCRSCVECKAAHAVKMAALRRSRYAERVIENGRWVHPQARHGTANGYNHFGCRCEPCEEANREVGRQYRAARRSRGEAS